MWSRRLMNTLLLRPILPILTRNRISGQENIPQDEPFILMINHCNFLDPGIGLYAILPQETVLFTKVENLRLPVAGLLLRWYGAVPVERGEADVTAIKRAIATLSQERENILIAPEGTRSHHGRLLPGKDGMAFIAVRTDAPILPMGIAGMSHFWTNIKRLHRTKTQVQIGHPFRFRHNGRVRKQAIKEMTREAMYQLAALLPPEQRGAYADLENATEQHLSFLQSGQSNLAYACRQKSDAPGPIAEQTVSVSP